MSTLTETIVGNPICPLCGRIIHDRHDCYEIIITYLAWKERNGRWWVCSDCFETSEACKILNMATRFVADRRYRRPTQQLREFVGWYIEDAARYVYHLLVNRWAGRRNRNAKRP